MTNPMEDHRVERDLLVHVRRSCVVHSTIGPSQLENVGLTRLFLVYVASLSGLLRLTTMPAARTRLKEADLHDPALLR